jgi:hypothetical protein
MFAQWDIDENWTSYRCRSDEAVCVQYLMWLWQMLHWKNKQTFRSMHWGAQGLFEKSKLVQHVYEEGHKICWNEAKILQIEPNTTYRKYKESTHISDRSSDQPTQLGLLLSQQKLKNYNFIQWRLNGKIGVLYVGTIQRIYLFSDYFYSDSTVVVGLMCVEFFF